LLPTIHSHANSFGVILQLNGQGGRRQQPQMGMPGASGE